MTRLGQHFDLAELYSGWLLQLWIACHDVGAECVVEVCRTRQRVFLGICFFLGCVALFAGSKSLSLAHQLVSSYARLGSAAACLNASCLHHGILISKCMSTCVMALALELLAQSFPEINIKPFLRFFIQAEALGARSPDGCCKLAQLSSATIGRRSSLDVVQVCTTQTMNTFVIPENTQVRPRGSGE